MNIDWNQRYIDADTPWDSGVPSRELQRIIDRLSIKPCRTLELGCGTGTNAIYLAQAGFDVTAVDLSAAALEMAEKKTKEAGVSVKYLQADVTNMPDLGRFAFVFDRGTYHVVRQINLKAFQSMLANSVEPGGTYLVLAGNANELGDLEKGPPRVRAHEICGELESKAFDLIRLDESKFDGVQLGGQTFTPLAFTAVFRRRTEDRA